MKKFDEFKGLTSFFFQDSITPSIELLMNQKMKITDLDIVKK